MNGFLNLLKPPGMSSGAAVAAVKRLTGERVGHAGTLDPEAAGVLPIMVGRATRLLDFFPDKSKSYVAEIAFSGATDTQDGQGVILEEGRGVPGRQEILAILPRFRGTILSSFGSTTRIFTARIPPLPCHPSSGTAPRSAPPAHPSAHRKTGFVCPSARGSG